MSAPDERGCPHCDAGTFSGGAGAIRGAGLHHLKFLTGQQARTAPGFMQRAGILPRHPGGRSPFLRRWQDGGSEDLGKRTRHALRVTGTAQPIKGDAQQ